MSITDRASKLEKPQKGKAWQPEPGDSIGGSVAAWRPVETKFGFQHLLQFHEEKTGELIDIWCRTVLQRSLKSLGIRVGDEVGIKYYGKPEGKSYHGYGVVAERDGKPLEPQDSEEVESDLSAKERAAEKAADIARELEDDVPF